MYMKLIVVKALVIMLACSLFVIAEEHALDFDGSDFVVIPDQPSLNPSEISVEFWVYFNHLSTDWPPQFILCKGSDRTVGGYRLNQGYNKLSFKFGPLGTTYKVEVVVDLETERWYHVAGTYDGNMLSFYLDGDMIGENEVGPYSIGCSENLFLSQNNIPGYPYYFTGYIDEIRVWDHARTEEQISSNMNNILAGSEEGLVGYWQLNEGIGQYIQDLTQYGNDGWLGSSESVDSHDPEWIASTHWLQSAVQASLPCTPTQGTLPFLLRLGVIMDNLVDNYRTFAGRVDVTLANGTAYTNYRAGYTNLLPLEHRENWWNQNLPNVGSLEGENTFLLTVMDVTPPPYNQPPFWPSGDTDTDSCTVTGTAP